MTPTPWRPNWPRPTRTTPGCTSPPPSTTPSATAPSPSWLNLFRYENLAGRGCRPGAASRPRVHPGADRAGRDGLGVHRPVRVLRAVPVPARRRTGGAERGPARRPVRRGDLPGGGRHLAADLAGAGRAALGPTHPRTGRSGAV